MLTAASVLLGVKAIDVVACVEAEWVVLESEETERAVSV